MVKQPNEFFKVFCFAKLILEFYCVSANEWVALLAIYKFFMGNYGNDQIKSVRRENIKHYIVLATILINQQSFLRTFIDCVFLCDMVFYIFGPSLTKASFSICNLQQTKSPNTQ
jgi:hypothetical protein